MAKEYSRRHVTDEERRDFLKALGVGGAVAAGGATLDDVREVVEPTTGGELAAIGQQIQDDLTGSLDAELLASAQSAFAERASELPAVAERELPTDGAREEFAAAAEPGWEVYDHLLEVGFFESTTQRLPEFTPEYLESSVQTFVGSEALSGAFDGLGLSDEEGIDLAATVVSNAERISTHHWVATDEIPRKQLDYGEYIPDVTQAVAGGVLLWLGDLDDHLWRRQVLISDEILSDAVWHAHSMTAGFHLMAEGAKAVAGESGELSNEELAALLSTGFAVQAISQYLLPQDAYWITDEMRAEGGPEIELIDDITTE